MNAFLEHTAQAIANAAGWKKPQPDSEGNFSFSLEGDLDFTLLSPDGKTGVFLARLAEAPDATSPQGSAELERIAALAAGVLRSRTSVVSISEQNILELHHSFPLQKASENDVLAHARDFINDFSWWKKQLQSNGQSRQ
ncbi:MAG: type III secretion system chaperone, partial [Mailhella sp.]|nr:type III secretion system chaperone [Mailhella sp.]